MTGRPAVPGFLQARRPELLACLAVLVLRLPTLSDRILSTDEPSYLLQAVRLDSVEAFFYSYLYRTETKAQVGLLPYMVANLFAPDHAVLAIRVLVLLALLAGALLLIALSRRALGGPGPGLAAAGITALYMATGSGYFTSPFVQGEFWLGAKLGDFQGPVVLLCLLLLVAAPAPDRAPRARYALLAGAGAAWAVALLITLGVALLGPVCLLALTWLWPGAGGAGRLRSLAGAAAAFLAGAAVPLALEFGPYGLRPATLSELRFVFLDLNSSYVAGPSLVVRLLALLLGLPTLLLLGFLLAPVVAGRLRRGSPATPADRVLPLLVLAAGAIFVASLPGQGLLHYLIPVVPLMALAVCGYLAAIGRVLAARRGAAAARAAGIALAAGYLALQVPALIALPGVATADAYLVQDRSNFDLDGLVAYVQAQTAPGTPVWVYYNAPEINLLAHRPGVTRDPQADWLAFLWTPAAFARDLADLQAAPPPLILAVDHPHLQFAHTTPVTAIPGGLGAWIAASYRCDPGRFRGATVCVRR